jgi:8-oxo-dGTP diphosphatase
MWTGRSDREQWETRVVAFAIVRRNSGEWLVVRHRRDGEIRWEIPGGHVEAGETLEAAATRETFEETGVCIKVGDLVANCMHEWPERLQRRLISFFIAVPTAEESTVPAEGDAEILSAGWLHPGRLPLSDTSPFLHPLIAADRRMGTPGAELLSYRTEHRVLPDGTIGPVLL